MSGMTTQKKKSAPKKSAPAKKAAPTKKTATKKAAPKKSSIKKAPAKKSAAQKVKKAASPVIKVTKKQTSSSNPDIKVSFNTAPIHTAVDKTVDNFSVIINDAVDKYETVMENINLVFPDEVKKLSFFKRIFRLKK